MFKDLEDHPEGQDRLAPLDQRGVQVPQKEPGEFPGTHLSLGVGEEAGSAFSPTCDFGQVT